MIDLTIFTSLVSPIIIIGCLILGYVIKHVIPNDTINRFIPLILCFTGIILNVWSLGAFTFDTVMAGAASGLAATGAYEAFKNMIDHISDSEEEKAIAPKGKHLK